MIVRNARLAQSSLCSSLLRFAIVLLFAFALLQNENLAERIEARARARARVWEPARTEPSAPSAERTDWSRLNVSALSADEMLGELALLPAEGTLGWWALAQRTRSLPCDLLLGYPSNAAWHSHMRVWCGTVTESAHVAAEAEQRHQAETEAEQKERKATDELRSAVRQRAAVRSRLSCAGVHHPLHAPRSAPHSYCVGRYLALSLSGLEKANSPSERARYGRGDGLYFRLAKGSWSGNCQRTPHFVKSHVTRDLLRDTVAAFSAVGNGESSLVDWQLLNQESVWHAATPGFVNQTSTTERLADVGLPAAAEQSGMVAPGVLRIVEPTLVVTREGHESTNLFHTVTDLLNAYQLVSVLQLQPGRDPMRVLFMDNNPPGQQLDGLWQVFSPRAPLLHANVLSGRTPRPPLATPTRYGASAPSPQPAHTLLLARPLFSAPGYNSMLYAALVEDAKRVLTCGGVRFLQDFGRLVRKHFDARQVVPHSDENFWRPPFRLVLVDRQPYGEHSLNHVRLQRMLLNRDHLIRLIREDYPEVELRVVDFARMSLAEQVRTAAHAHVLIGVHGAALAHQTWMRPGSVLLQLMPPEKYGWRTFHGAASWLGQNYFQMSLPGCEAGCKANAQKFRATLRKVMDRLQIESQRRGGIDTETP